jgi:hypothetical protein
MSYLPKEMCGRDIQGASRSRLFAGTRAKPMMMIRTTNGFSAYDKQDAGCFIVLLDFRYYTKLFVTGAVFILVHFK